MNKIQQFIVENQEVFIGLEDSKRTWALCVRSNGAIIHETSMPANIDNLLRYIGNKFPQCRITIMYEAGFSGFGIYDALITNGYKCVVTPPHTVTKEACQKRKNDRIDCRRLAKNLENGDYRYCYIPSQYLREDRAVSRIYEQIQRDIVRVSNRIRRSLEFHGIDKELRPGRWSRKDYRELKEKILEMQLSASLQFSFQALFDEQERLWDIHKQVLKELYALAKTEPYHTDVALLITVPGVGVLTAIRFLLEIGDIKRFAQKEKFTSFLGLIPSEHSSGNTEHKGHITKQGCRWARTWLVECGWSAIRKDPALLDKYNRVVRNTGSKKKAMVAVARKLAIRIRAVLLSGEPYMMGLIS